MMVGISSRSSLSPWSCEHQPKLSKNRNVIASADNILEMYIDGVPLFQRRFLWLPAGSFDGRLSVDF